MPEPSQTPAEQDVTAIPRRNFVGKYRLFLLKLAESGNATLAASLTGHDTSALYKARKFDLEFRQRWRQAVRMARKRKIDAAESRLKHLAVDGLDDPVYQGGKLVGTRRRYSVDALKFLLQAELPSKYGRRQDAVPTVNVQIDARQAYLRDPEALRLALQLDERLATMARSTPSTTLETPSRPAGQQHDDDAQQASSSTLETPSTTPSSSTTTTTLETPSTTTTTPSSTTTAKRYKHPRTPRVGG